MFDIDITRPKKFFILDILNILRKYTDEKHKLTTEDICKILINEYSHKKAERKSVKRNLDNLIDDRYKINYSVTPRKKNRYGDEDELCTDWYIERDFSDAELRLLIDSLLFSKHISNRKCKELIIKLENLSNVYFKSNAKHIRSMPEEKYPGNEKLFDTIKILDEAISERVKVSFNYIEYGLDKKPYSRKDKKGESAIYIVSPYQMVATNGRYYLISNLDCYDNVTIFRLDRIKKIQKLKDKSKPENQVTGFNKKNLDLPKFMAERIYMFSGESVKVKFKAEQSFISDILDWFGFGVWLIKQPDDSIHVIIENVNEQAMFYWAMQYGEHIEILSPLSLRKKLHEASVKMIEKYKN